MLPPNFKQPLSPAGVACALAGLALAVAAILIALGFQHFGGFIPCALCLEQRTPYYAAIPALAAGLVLHAGASPAFVVRGLFAIAALVMAYGAFLGIHHAGFEWGLWAGPTDCAVVAGGGTVAADGLLAAIDGVKPPSCDEAALRVLGLSFAGWNALAASAAAMLAGLAAFRR
jgi:disulfide bond formation protein DsbB